MIKINLLATQRTKKARKKVALESQAIWIGLASGVMVLVWLVAWRLLDGKVTRLQEEKARAAADLAVLKVQVKEVDTFEADKVAVREKIKVIQRLRKNQSMPVYLLNEISQRLPERVWLVSLSEKGGTVDLSGKATTNSEIVDFINNLKAADRFENVEILESRQKKEGEITIYSFRLKWSLVT